MFLVFLISSKNMPLLIFFTPLIFANISNFGTLTIGLFHYLSQLLVERLQIMYL